MHAEQKPNKPQGTVIVLGRQFGSGARSIGTIIAKKLGIGYYDKEILARSASQLGFSPDIFAHADEKRPSPLRSIMQGFYGIPDNFHTTSFCGERLYREQSAVINKIAETESCVIVGRSADYVLRDHPGLVSIFLHAPLPHRVKKIMERNDADNETKAAELARKRDRDRESYYNYFTGGEGWGRADNYHLSVDASLLDDEAAADLIISFIKSQKQRNNNSSQL